MPLGSIEMRTGPLESMCRDERIWQACLPTDAERELERQRLIQKLRTGLVNDVWLPPDGNCKKLQKLLGGQIACPLCLLALL